MTTRLDLGVGDVHVPGAIGAQKGHQMAKLTTAKRKGLRKDQFADPANRAYPIHDKAHADNAAARLEQQKGSMSQGKYRAIKSRIRAAQRRFGTKAVTGASSTGLFKIHLTAPDGSRTVIRHRLGQTTASYDLETDVLRLAFDIDKAEALADSTDEKKRVWVQIARTGAWAGHPQGAFQITEATLDTIVQNFYSQGFGRIQWDFDHCSAMPANSGTIPQVGKPAQGWAYELKRVGSKLYALTEWLPLARQYLENDQYGGVSPVINWKATDRVSNKPIGPIITSIALTNIPFILGMEKPMAASADGLPETPRGPMPLTEVQLAADPQQTELSASAYKCYSSAELVPQLKQIFGLHPLATAAQCADMMANLRSHLEAVDGQGDARHEGIDLAQYTMPLRQMVNAHAGMDWFAILDIIDELLDAYLDRHGLPDFEETHGPIPGAETESSAAAAAPATAASADASVQIAVEPPLAVAAPAQATESTQATETAASAAVAELPGAELSALTLKVAELNALASRLEAENAALRNAKAAADESALTAEVDDAFVTYKDAKGLVEENKAHMLSMLRATPDAFRALYPPVDPDKRHLLLNLTGKRVEADNPAPIADPIEPDTKTQQILDLGLFKLTQKLVVDSGHSLSYGSAQITAQRMLAEARNQGNPRK